MNKTLFFETPRDKLRVFQRPRLVMFSAEVEIAGWENTQPLYFYPFSWLDYLGKEGIRELYIQDACLDASIEEMEFLNNGKVNLEMPDGRLIKIAKERGHKVSVICDFSDISREKISDLSLSDFVRVRVNKDTGSLLPLSALPNEHILSCIKIYVGEGCDYRSVALQSKDIGFDFLHVAKRLCIGETNPRVTEEEKEKIKDLKELETETFKVVIPSSLEETFARRFAITPKLGNVFSCDFSKYRLVMKGGKLYPCYSRDVLNLPGFSKREEVKPIRNCLDCACIYENDMLQDIESKMKGYKNLHFALEYIENGR